MKSYFILLIFSVLIACQSPKPKQVAEVNNTIAPVIEKDYFPVTNYIRGQINEIRTSGINPIKITGIDSVWIKVEDLEKEMVDFLHPEIDTSNLIPFFSEARFLDQTVDAYTFTYEPKGILPDSISLRHWDVYIDPKKNIVRRIYIVKEEHAITRQLTWQSNKWCKVVTIGNDKDGNQKVLKETLITWDF